jgi:hypothetical protein
MMKHNKWALLAFQCEYLAAENRILRSQLPARLRLADEQRSTLAEIGKRLGNISIPKDAEQGKDQIVAFLEASRRWMQAAKVATSARPFERFFGEEVNDEIQKDGQYWSYRQRSRAR